MSARYSVWVTASGPPGGLDIGAHVVPDGQGAPPGGPMVPRAQRAEGMTYRECIMRGVPERIADQVARSYIAVMHDQAQSSEPVEPLPAARAAQLLLLVATGSRRDARRLARALGCGGGSSDFDLAIGRALLADPDRLREALHDALAM